MSREADATIKGFLYQFVKTLDEILDSEIDAVITVEGIIEDIDIDTESGVRAVQCKYHESKEKCSNSDIAKPILQCLTHYAKHASKEISYVLYAHFSEEQVGEKKLEVDDIIDILNTKNVEYITKYVSKIKPPKDDKIKEILSKSKKTRDDKSKIKNYYIENGNDLEISINISDFLSEKFTFEIGASFSGLEEKVKEMIRNEGFSSKDTSDLFFPNAVQEIAELSIKPNSNLRKITKEELIEKLKERKKSAISRWTRELSDYKKALKKRREQLRTGLNSNNRKRYFFIRTSEIKDFNDEVINFIKDYSEKYIHKPKLHHNSVPVFCFEGESQLVLDLTSRLYQKGIESENGYRGDKFYKEAFSRTPKFIEKDEWIEFKVRLGILEDDLIEIMNSNKADDVFIINKVDTKSLNIQDTNIEEMEVETLEELKYLLQLRSEF